MTDIELAQKIAGEIEQIARSTEEACPCESDGERAVLAPQVEWDLIVKALRAYKPAAGGL